MADNLSNHFFGEPDADWDRRHAINAEVRRINKKLTDQIIAAKRRKNKARQIAKELEQHQWDNDQAVPDSLNQLEVLVEGKKKALGMK
jgi:hypothetical protein